MAFTNMTTITITQDALDSIMTRLSALETENTKLKARVDCEFDDDEDAEMDFWNKTDECNWTSLRFAAKLVVGCDSADMGMFGDVKMLSESVTELHKEVTELREHLSFADRGELHVRGQWVPALKDVRAWCAKKYGSQWWSDDKDARKKEARLALVRKHTVSL